MIRLMRTDELNDYLSGIYLHKFELQKGTERHLKATPMARIARQTRIEFLANISTRRCFLEGYPVSVERTPACFSAIGHRLA